MRIHKDVLWVTVMLALFYAVMEVYYTSFIVPLYFNYHFSLNFSLTKYAETKVYFVLLLLLLPLIAKWNEFIYSIIVMVVVFFLVPTLVTYSFANQSPIPLYSILLTILCLAAIAQVRITFPTIVFPRPSDGLIIALLLTFIIPFLIRFGLYFNISNLALREIDSTRGQFSALSSPFHDYVYHWMVHAILPIALVYFYARRRMAVANLVSIAILYMYFISGNKIVLVTLFTMIYFMLIGTNYLSKSKHLTVGLLAALILIPLFDLFILRDHTLKGTFVMRMLFLPAQLNYLYIDFFNEIHLYYSQSHFFRSLFTYPYDVPVGYVISSAYFHASQMNANNGFISDGFMNLGFLGILLHIVVVVAVFQYFSSVPISAKYFGIFVVIVFLLLSSPLLSMFTTSGLALVMIFAWLSNRRHDTNTGSLK